MANTYIKAYAYNGHDITLQLRTETGETSLTNPTRTEKTHTIVGELDSLSTLAPITVGADGSVVTDASMDNLYVSAVDIDGGDRIYTDAFTKPVDSDTLTFTGDSPITVTTGQTLNVYYLADGSPGTLDGILKNEISTQWLAAEAKLQADAAGADPDIYSLMIGLGATLD